MAGMELPLLAPATPDIQAAPVVKPQAESGARIAQAGGEVQETARNIWLYNRQARYDHDEAWTNAYAGTLQGVTDGVNADIHAGKIGPDTAEAETIKRVNAAAQPYIDQSSGAFKEKLEGMRIAHLKTAPEQALIHATAENVQRQDANYKQSVNDLTNRIVLTPHDGQGPLLTQLHGSIDDYGQRHNLPPATVQNMHDDANAKIALGHFQVMAVEDPAHFITMAETPGFLEKNADTFARTGGAKTLEGMINQADTAMTLPYKQAEIAQKARAADVWAQMDQATIAGDTGKLNALADYATKNGLATQNEVRQHGIPGYETPVSIESMNQANGWQDSHPGETDMEKALQFFPGTNRGAAMARTRWLARGADQKKQQEDPIHLNGYQMWGEMKGKLFNPGFGGLSAEKQNQRAAADKAADYIIGHAKSMDDMRKGLEGLQAQYAPKPIAGTNTAAMKRLSDDFHAGKMTSKEFYEALGKMTH